MENKLLITEEQIGKIEQFNLEVLKEAIRQAELRINDENARKERIDKRAYAFLSFLIGVITFVFALQNTKYLNEVAIAISGLTVLLLLIPTLVIVRVLQPRQYAALGTFPYMWLQKEFIESKETSSDKVMLGYMLTHVLHQMNDSIIASDKSNEARLGLLSRALNLSIVAIVPIAFAIALSLASSISSYLF